MMQSMLLIGNFGMTEILVIVGAIILLFGSSQIPKVAKSIGQGLKEFKKAFKNGEKDDAEEEVTEEKTGNKKK